MRQHQERRRQACLHITPPTGFGGHPMDRGEEERDDDHRQRHGHGASRPNLHQEIWAVEIGDAGRHSRRAIEQARGQVVTGQGRAERGKDEGRLVGQKVVGAQQVRRLHEEIRQRRVIAERGQAIAVAIVREAQREGVALAHLPVEHVINRRM